MVSIVFADPSGPPQPDAVRRTLGPVAQLWDDLTLRLTTSMGASPHFAWGGRKYGWELDFRRAGRPFVSLSPGDQEFTALIVFGRAAWDGVEGAQVSQRTRQILDATPQLHDGRWVYLHVRDEADAGDVGTLLELKLPPTIRARLQGAKALAH